MGNQQLDLSVIIITLNEEKTLEQTLRSLPQGIELIVVDSYSSDKTREIAVKYGAVFVERQFEDFATQKNTALSHCGRNWVLSLDADEILDKTLREFLVEFTSKPQSPDQAYRIRRQLIFLGRKMRFGKTVDYPLRLFHKEKGRFKGGIHEVLETSPPVQKLKYREGTVLHHSYQNLGNYFEKFNFYTSRIAERHLTNGNKPYRALTHLIRPWSEFITRYFICLGLLDGYPGYCYALLSSFYSFVKYAKFRELCENESPMTCQPATLKKSGI